jgi:hypothetical protein
MFQKLPLPAIGPMALVLVALGCSFTPPSLPQAGPDPAGAAAQVRPLTDASVLGPYQSFRPVTPRSWREQNERVTPQPRP